MFSHWSLLDLTYFRLLKNSSAPTHSTKMGMVSLEGLESEGPKSYMLIFCYIEHDRMT